MQFLSHKTLTVWDVTEGPSIGWQIHQSSVPKNQNTLEKRPAQEKRPPWPFISSVVFLRDHPLLGSPARGRLKEPIRRWENVALVWLYMGFIRFNIIWIIIRENLVWYGFYRGFLRFDVDSHRIRMGIYIYKYIYIYHPVSSNVGNSLQSIEVFSGGYRVGYQWHSPHHESVPGWWSPKTTC